VAGRRRVEGFSLETEIAGTTRFWTISKGELPIE
jgi:hypothetical protein